MEDCFFISQTQQFDDKFYDEYLLNLRSLSILISILKHYQKIKPKEFKIRFKYCKLIWFYVLQMFLNCLKSVFYIHIIDYFEIVLWAKLILH